MKPSSATISELRDEQRGDRGPAGLARARAEALAEPFWNHSMRCVRWAQAMTSRMLVTMPAAIDRPMT